jgi:hypothetical protein
MHEGLSAVYDYARQKDKAPVGVTLKKTVQRAFEKLKPKTWAPADEVEAYTRRRILGEMILSEYVRHYHADFGCQTEDFKPGDAPRWYSPESLFSYKWRGYVLRGRIDGAVSLPGEEQPWLFESKNFSVIKPDDFMATLAGDWQLNFYLFSLWELNGRKWQPGGALFNILRRPQSKPRKGEDYQAFIRRLRKDYRKQPDHYFVRLPVAVQANALPRFEKYLYEVLYNFREWWRSGRPVTTFGQPCSGRYGLCRYVPLCYSADFTGFYKAKRMHPELEP